MANLNLMVRGDIKDWIERRVSEGKYASPAEYLSDLVERDRDENATDEERIEALRRIVREAEQSGVSDKTVKETFDEVVAEAKARGTYRA